MDSIDMNLIKALIKLSPQTTRQIAEDCGMKQPNLMAALAGQRELPKAKTSSLLEALGIPDGMLECDKVHFWVVGMDLSPLALAVKMLFTHGAELAGVWRQGGGVFDLSRAFDQQMFVITDHRRWILIKRSGLGTLMPTAKPIAPETIPGLRWRGGKIGADTMVAISEDLYPEWSQGRGISLDILMLALGADTGIGWDEVVQAMKRLGLTPEAALGIIHEWSAHQNQAKPWGAPPNDYSS